MKILVINAGSSSLKYQLIDMETETVLAKGQCERIGIEGSQLKHTPLGKETVIIKQPMQNHADAIDMVLAALTNAEYGVISSMDEIAAVGHRVVHGGEMFNKSCIIDDAVKKAIEECVPLAPLHNPPNLIGINACEKAMPGKPQIAVFDTAFHQTMPREAYMYALPYRYYEEDKIRRYGFHGTSHKYVSIRASKMLQKPLEELKLITCHLGNGSSITAIDGGRSVATSMGFTPLAGLVMGTRSGSIDPAIIKFIADKEHMDLDGIDRVLNKESGVLGISGISSDFRDLEAAADDGNDRAKLALEMFVYSVRKYIGMYLVQMGGVDAIIFTAGIGENTPAMRTEVLKDMDFLGVWIDEEKNAQARGKEAIVSTADSKVKVLVVPTNEELMIARDTAELIR